MIMSDDEAQGSTSDSHMSHIYDIGEGDEEPSPPAQLFPPRAKDAADFSPTTSPIASLGVQAGPSNLTRAMAASHKPALKAAKLLSAPRMMAAKLRHVSPPSSAFRSPSPPPEPRRGGRAGGQELGRRPCRCLACE